MLRRHHPIAPRHMLAPSSLTIPPPIPLLSCYYPTSPTLSHIHARPPTPAPHSAPHPTSNPSTRRNPLQPIANPCPVTASAVHPAARLLACYSSATWPRLHSASPAARATNGMSTSLRMASAYPPSTSPRTHSQSLSHYSQPDERMFAGNFFWTDGQLAL